jgi:predicted amidohydrolase
LTRDNIKNAFSIATSAATSSTAILVVTPEATATTASSSAHKVQLIDV